MRMSNKCMKDSQVTIYQWTFLKLKNVKSFSEKMVSLIGDVLAKNKRKNTWRQKLLENFMMKLEKDKLSKKWKVKRTFLNKSFILKLWSNTSHMSKITLWEEPLNKTLNKLSILMKILNMKPQAMNKIL